MKPTTQEKQKVQKSDITEQMLVDSAPSKTPSAFVREEVPCCLDLLKVS